MEADLSGLSFQELQALCQAVGLELEVWSKEAMVASLRAHAEVGESMTCLEGGRLRNNPCSSSF